MRWHYEGSADSRVIIGVQIQPHSILNQHNYFYPLKIAILWIISGPGVVAFPTFLFIYF